MEAKATKKKVNKYSKREIALGYAFASPWLLGLFLLTLFPIVLSFFLSMTNFKLYATDFKFVWFQNYVSIFTLEPAFWPSMKNTFIYVLISVPINLVCSLLVAMLLNVKTFGIKTYRALFYLPNLVSIVAVVLLWQWMFNPQFGALNQILALFGIQGPDWLKSDFWAKPSLVLMGLWNIGGTVVIFLASLVDVPTSLYEAARLDGANVFVKFFRITLPMISPIIYFNLIMALINGFQTFVPSYLMTGGLYGTNFMGLVIYQEAFGSAKALGKASAFAWILMVVILIITRILMRITNKAVFYGDE